MTILESILNEVAAIIRDGITTKEIDAFIEKKIREWDLIPVFLHYKPTNFGTEDGFPAVSCISINDELVHGIPGPRIIRNGDVVKIDVGVKDEDGIIDDGATTILVGHCSSAARKVVTATREALTEALEQAKAGKTTHDIARAVEKVAEKYGVYIIEHYGGHGVGEKLHMDPAIPNRVEGNPVVLEKGMRIAIEPMLASRSGKTYLDDDEWTVKLYDGGVCAHFEKTINIE